MIRPFSHSDAKKIKQLSRQATETLSFTNITHQQLKKEDWKMTTVDEKTEHNHSAKNSSSSVVPFSLTQPTTQLKLAPSDGASESKKSVEVLKSIRPKTANAVIGRKASNIPNTSKVSESGSQDTESALSNTDSNPDKTLIQVNTLGTTVEIFIIMNRNMYPL